MNRGHAEKLGGCSCRRLLEECRERYGTGTRALVSWGASGTWFFFAWLAKKKLQYFS
ncbi:hypothetical protein BDW74DRAFT_161161 [Aspergillus multicolor]|uniref:uncharacterized protein n=1 Tax=Aspergillus multicolor TaxID=41759 RepID=UPI003CCE0418